MYFLNIIHKVLDYLKTKNEVFLFKGFAGADEKYRLPIQVVTELAWHNLFGQQLFIRPTEEELKYDYALIFCCVCTSF